MCLFECESHFDAYKPLKFHTTNNRANFESCKRSLIKFQTKTKEKLNYIRSLLALNCSVKAVASSTSPLAFEIIYLGHINTNNHTHKWYPILVESSYGCHQHLIHLSMNIESQKIKPQPQLKSPLRAGLHYGEENNGGELFSWMVK